MPESTDIAIIGGGPAGLTAALYAARSRARTLVFESALPGGQIVTTAWIENYPGFPDGLPGSQVGELMHAQAERFGAEFRTFEQVEALAPIAGGWEIVAGDETVQAKAVILATGAVPRKLGIPGEAEYTGRGVSWCATCDGAFFREKEVAVIGGGDAAAEEAEFLTKFASRVYLVHRRDELRATKCVAERCLANSKVEMRWSRVPVEIVGEEGRVTGVRLESTKGEPEEFLSVSGVFIFVGVEPKNTLVRDLAELSDAGFVRIDDACMTSAPGLFAAGDVTDRPLKQVITAAAQGAVAGFEATRYVDSQACTL